MRRYNEICLIKYICLNCKPNLYQKYVYVYISIPMHINPYIYNTTRSFSLPLQTKRNKKGCSPTRAPKNPSTLAVGVLLLNCHNLHRTRQFGVDILLQNSKNNIPNRAETWWFTMVEFVKTSPTKHMQFTKMLRRKGTTSRVGLRFRETHLYSIYPVVVLACRCHH